MELNMKVDIDPEEFLKSMKSIPIGTSLDIMTKDINLENYLKLIEWLDKTFDFISLIEELSEDRQNEIGNHFQSPKKSDQVGMDTRIEMNAEHIEAALLLDESYFSDEDYWNYIVERGDNIGYVTEIVKCIDRRHNLCSISETDSIIALRKELEKYRLEIAIERINTSKVCDCPGSTDAIMKIVRDDRGRHVAKCPRCNKQEFIFEKDKKEETNAIK